ncbi:MAG: sodium:solute symporter family protein [Bacteroidota bacterium]
MNLHPIDIGIIILYIIATVVIGFWISKRASRSMESYFLGGNEIPWYYLGLSNASGMFDISGTMWMVGLLFLYGLKSVFIPWLWPVFNQIFLMVFLSVWLRRSGVMTGAEWIKFRFGTSTSANLSHIIVVIFALLNVIGFLAYGFVGIGKFAAAFLPYELSVDPRWNEIYYGLIITAITTAYVVKGGMFSVVFTEVLQFFIMTIACIAVGIIAMNQVSPDVLAQYIPAGWKDISFGWELGLDWSEILPNANAYISKEGYELFTIFFMLVLFKGVLQSMAGPAPTYDMQRVLSTKTPKDAAKMSGLVNLILLFPRYMLITGLAILALVFFNEELAGMGENVDFEQILPFALANFVPTGLLGLLIAGLLAAFMSTFAATTNAAPAYVVNDIYKRYINNTASDKRYVYMSYAVSLLFVVIGTAIGLFITSLNELIGWLVAGLYGGYTAANLLKWYWWRFNGYGYFWGMLAGIVCALAFPLVQEYYLPEVNALEAFPGLLLISLIVSILASLLTPPDEEEVLKNFYKKTRPWGFWGPIIAACRADDPDLKTNQGFARDAFNVTVGIIWQTSLTAAPIFLVIQYWTAFWIALAVAAGLTALLKFSWYDKLQSYPE